MDRLWPDAGADEAANRLHKAAHYARRTTGAADCVSIRHEVVALFEGRELVVDAVAFEGAAVAALRAGDPGAAEVALAAWTGDLLPGDPYESWAFQPRQRIQLLHRELLRRAGRWHELVELDPTDEEAHLGVVQTALASGDRGGALRQLDLLEQILRDELGIGPSPRGPRPARARARHPGRRSRASPRASLRLTRRRTTTRGPRPAGRALLPDGGRRPARLRHQRQRATSGEGLHVADASGPRLGEPGLVALVAGVVAGATAGQVRRARLRPVGLVGRRLLVHPRRLGPRPRGGRRHPGPRAVPPARHVPGRSDRPHLRRSAPGARQPPRDLRHLCARDLGEGGAGRTAVAGRARRADQDVLGFGTAGVPPGVRRAVPARRAAGAVARLRRAPAPIHVGRERLPAVARLREPGRERGRAAA